MKRHVLVADIVEDVILGIDIIHEHGFALDLRKRILRVGTEELIQHPKEDLRAQMLLAEDVTVPQRSDLLENCFEKATVAMLVPPNEVTGGSKEVLVAKALVVLGKEVPAQMIMNINSHPIRLRKVSDWVIVHLQLRLAPRENKIRRIGCCHLNGRDDSLGMYFPN